MKNYFYTGVVFLAFIFTSCQSDNDNVSELAFYSSSINLEVATNKISGVAPLHVTFDATATTGLSDDNNYVLANFSWNFDATNTDPDGKWEKTKGFYTAHVFERPGVYTVVVKVKDAAQNEASTHITITVNEFDKTSYFVAADGNDENTGTSQDSPLKTVKEGLSRTSSGDRILLKNGDIIEESTAIIIDQDGIGIGTYGEGEKAILRVTATSKGGISVGNNNNIRLMDFHLQVPNQGSAAIKLGGTNNLAYNLEISDARGGTALEHHKDTDNVIWNTYLHDFGPYGVFCQQFERVAIIGLKIRNLDYFKPEHGIRAVSGSKLYIAFCDFETEIAKTAFAIRYNGKQSHVPTNNIVMIGNKVDRQVQGGWVNSIEGSPVKYVLFEDNYIAPSKFPGGVASPNFSGFKTRWASNVAVRNNVISKKARAIIIEGNDNVSEPISNIWVYNNTIFNMDNSNAASGPFAINFDVTNASIECKNNIYYGNQNNSRMFGGDVVNAIVSNNLHFRTIGGSYDDPEDVIHENPAFLSVDDGTAGFALLSSNSLAAIDKGDAIAVFYDKAGNPRIGPIDLGAYEYD